MLKRTPYDAPRRWGSLLMALLPMWVWALGLLAIAFSGFALSEYFREVSWARHGIKTEGRVVASDHQWTEEGYEYVLTFRYEHNGVEYVIPNEVGGRTWERLPVGAKDSFYIHAKRPAEIRQVLGVGYQSSPWMQGVATILWLPLLAAFWCAGLGAARAINVRRFGDRVAAELVAIEPAAPSWRNRHGHERLLWKTENGRFGQSLPMHPKRATQFEPDETLWVYVGPQKDWWEGDVGPRARLPRPIPTVPAPRGE